MSKKNCILVYKETEETIRITISSPISYTELLKGCVEILKLDKSYNDYELFFSKEVITVNNLVDLNDGDVMLLFRKTKWGSMTSKIISKL